MDMEGTDHNVWVGAQSLQHNLDQYSIEIYTIDKIEG